MHCPFRLLTGLLALVITLGLAAGAPAGPTVQLCPPSLFDALDSDGDQKISLHEYARFTRDKKAASQNFQALDQDRDGVLKLADAGALFAKLDQNGDGLLNQTELMLRWQTPRFKTNLGKAAEDLEILDFNRDGSVDFDEFSRNWVGLALVSW
jgi:Ca2+-binding EF-hand superfamily protein